MQSKLPTTSTTNITNKQKNKRKKRKRNRNRVIENSKVDSDTDTDTDVSLPEIELDEVTTNSSEALAETVDIFDDPDFYGSTRTSENVSIRENSSKSKQTSTTTTTTTTTESKGKDEMGSSEDEVYNEINNENNAPITIEEINYNIDEMNVYGSIESNSDVADGSGPSGSGWGCELFRESKLEAKCFSERAAGIGERREKFAIGKRKVYLSEIGKLNV